MLTGTGRTLKIIQVGFNMKNLDLQSLKKDLKDVRAMLLKTILERNVDELDKSREALGRISASIDDKIAHLLSEDSPVCENLRPSLLEVRDLWGAFRKTRDEQILPAIREGRFDDASKIAMGIQEERFREFSSIVDLVENSQNLEWKVEEKTRAERENFYSFIRLFVDIMELFDSTTGGHVKRVAALVRRLALKVGLKGNDLDLVAAAANLHTIGLIGIPRDLLEKDEKHLRGIEKKMLRGYPQIGQGLLASMDTLKQVGLVIRSHMERYDGMGYPDGLRGEEIHIGARILAVCKAYDRARHRGKGFSPHSLALEELESMSGVVLDPMVVSEFISLMDEDTGQENYRKVHVWELEEGMKLVDKLITSKGRLLLTEGTVLTEEILTMINNYHRLDPIVTLVRVEPMETPEVEPAR